VSPQRPLGLVLVVVGVSLSYLGRYVADFASESITAAAALGDENPWLAISGAATAVAGLIVAFPLGGRERTE
jgi:uncharacterized protein YjeT (DUF2065 family)